MMIQLQVLRIEKIGIFRRFIEVEKIKIEKNTVQETLIIPL